MKIPKDGRTVGVIVHHVGNMYPIEIQLAQALGAGKPIAGVTWDAVADINAKHAKEHARGHKGRRPLSSCAETARPPPMPYARSPTSNWTRLRPCRSTRTRR